MFVIVWFTCKMCALQDRIII